MKMWKFACRKNSKWRNKDEGQAKPIWQLLPLFLWSRVISFSAAFVCKHCKISVYKAAVPPNSDFGGNDFGCVSLVHFQPQGQTNEFTQIQELSAPNPE